MAEKVIIGIHGLGNKPPRSLLKKWWLLSIQEGFSRLEVVRSPFLFEMVYWAHCFYHWPQNSSVVDRNSPRFLDHPYVPAKDVDGRPEAPSQWRKRALNWVEKWMDLIFLSEFPFLQMQSVSDFVIKKNFKELALYYGKYAEESAQRLRRRVRSELMRALQRHRRKDIMLIAHSMGSIIAYDVMVHEVPDIRIDTWVTLGSPLGIPAILREIMNEQNLDWKKIRKAPTPENITTAWYNIADLRDPVAVNFDLNDDFGANSVGVSPKDIVIRNDYENNGHRNHHNLYGYLRARETAEIIDNFLGKEKVRFWQRIWNRIAGV
jgi:hypothetical protein